LRHVVRFDLKNAVKSRLFFKKEIEKLNVGYINESGNYIL
jgi:hypothetical protein